METTGMGIGMWFFWAVIIVGVVLIVKLVIAPDSNRSISAASAEETLRLRYARGEIDQEEFEQMMRELRQ